jgi:hypothetical protein
MHKAAGQVGQVVPGKRRHQRSPKNINAQRDAYMDAVSMAAAEFATRDRDEGYMELAHNIRQMNQDTKTTGARLLSSLDEVPILGDLKAAANAYGTYKNGRELIEKGAEALGWIGGGIGGLFGGGAG